MGLRVGEGEWEESASFLLIFGEILSPTPPPLAREKLWSLRDSLENPLFSFGRRDRACLYPELEEKRRGEKLQIETHVQELTYGNNCPSYLSNPIPRFLLPRRQKLPGGIKTALANGQKHFFGGGTAGRKGGRRRRRDDIKKRKRHYSARSPIKGGHFRPRLAARRRPPPPRHGRSSSARPPSPPPLRCRFHLRASSTNLMQFFPLSDNAFVRSFRSSFVFFSPAPPFLPPSLPSPSLPSPRETIGPKKSWRAHSSSSISPLSLPPTRSLLFFGWAKDLPAFR